MANFAVLLGKSVALRVKDMAQEVSGIVAESELGSNWIKLLPLVQFTEEEKQSAISSKIAMHIIADDVRVVNELEIKVNGEKQSSKDR
jgi:hypothetical protein